MQVVGVITLNLKLCCSALLFFISAQRVSTKYLRYTYGTYLS